ncbi:MAG TPA: hypothetical protein VJL34_14220 [Anaerolineales bacterium]|nr:hypothetical protein [Anaerolineales bacterium]
MRWQVGQFFAFVGLLVVIFFLITGWAGSPEYIYLCAGASGLLFGGYLMWLGRNLPQPAERFRLLRGVRRRREARRQARGRRKEGGPEG